MSNQQRIDNFVKTVALSSQEKEYENNNNLEDLSKWKSILCLWSE